jgi:uncharacterized surface protein with fasciclin (FAS1) repeats
MNSTFFRNTIVGIIVTVFFAYTFSACNKTTTTIPVVSTTSTLATIIKNASNLTIFDSALSKAKLLSMLDSSNQGVYTVLAPPDIAFTSIGIADSTFAKMDTAFFRRLVSYHLIGGSSAITAAAIARDLPGPNSPYASMGGDILYFSVYGSMIYINGVLIKQEDVTGSNGVIHVLQNVLIPPTGSLLQTLKNISVADTTCSQFTAALDWASTGSTNLDTLLSNGGAFTVFVPNNAAFRTYFGDTLNVPFSTSGISPDSVATILKYHILQTRQFSPDFAQVAGYPTLLNNDSVYFFNAGAYIGKTDSTGGGFGATNIMANNGVIHKISAVLAH